MSSGYPFPDREIEKVENRFAPLPHDVDYIDSYAQCQNAMTNAQYTAAGRSQLRNDPRSLQYAEWFGAFGHQDRSIRRTDQDGNQQIQYWGGCKLLLTPETRRTMWPVAREELRETLTKFHSNQNMGNSTGPMVSCDARRSGSVQCKPY